MIKLDPKLVNQAQISKEKRKKYFKIAALPLAVCLILALGALRQPLYNSLLFHAMQHENYDFAAFISRLQIHANYAEPAVAYYNLGVANFEQGDFHSAEENFRNSLANDERKSKSCGARINLSLSIEMQADQAFTKREFEEAIKLYSRAESSLPRNKDSKLRDYNCSNIQESKSAASHRRIEDARKKALAERNVAIAPDVNLGNIKGDALEHEIDSDIIEKLRKEQSLKNRSTSLIRNKIGLDAALRAQPLPLHE